MADGSKIFSGQRVLGFVCNHIPIQLRYIEKRKDNIFITVVGNSFHTYGPRLSLLSVSSPLKHPITCIGVNAYMVFAATRGNIISYRRGIEVYRTYETDESRITHLLPFDKHLVSVNEKRLIQIWDIESGDIYTTIQLDDTFDVSAMMHPTTYLNKILLGSKQGALQLWNIKTNKLIHSFQGFGSEITVLEQAPAIDVVAIGHIDGSIILLNLKFEEQLMTLNQDWGPIRSISFRSDGESIMAVGSSFGHIGIWNLNEKKLVSQLRNAHHQDVFGLSFLPNQPVLISSSSDNTIKMWIFDLPDCAGRLLRFREGHGSPPNKIRFHGVNGKNIVSAGQDSTMRTFSTVKDHLNRNMGLALFNRKAPKRDSSKREIYKMPPVTDFYTETTQEKEWANLAACHRDLNLVTLWSCDRCTMTDQKLSHPRFHKEFSKAVAKSIHISTCGNFVLVGYDSGHVDKYNMQSGIHRGSYGNPTAHDGVVSGVVSDDVNTVVLTGGTDSNINIFSFKSCKLIQTIALKSPVLQMIIHKESGMVGVALDDFTIVVVDLEMRKIVRTFSGHLSPITDMTFNHDAKWLISSSMDCSIRVWDLPSAKLIDYFLVSSPCTSLTMSPTAEYLATAHVNNLGIHLWSNKSLYHHISLTPISNEFEPQYVDLTSAFDQESAKVEDSSNDDVMFGQETYASPEQLAMELITLSQLPDSRWKNILNLDIIKRRNKPKEPPKAPKSAPFFIPTVPDLEFKFDLSKEEPLEQEENPKSLIPLSNFQKTLLSCKEKSDFLKLMKEIQKLGLSAIELEIRSLSPDGGGSIDLLKQFLKLLMFSLETNKDFELVQAYCGLYLKIHADTLAAEKELIPDLKELLSLHEEVWRSLQTKFNQTLCIVNYLKSTALS